MSEKKFWKEIDDVRAAMLSIGAARHVPMTPFADEDRKRIWFIGAAGTDLVQAIEAGQTDASMIVSGSDNIHARIEADASLSNDRDKLEELWSPVADAWFSGMDDPDIRLIEIAPATAEVWVSPNALAFMFEIAKANVTDKHPDAGEHFSVTF